MTLSWLLIITILAAAFAIVDGVRRVRGRNNSVLAIAELVLAVLMLISVFIAFPAPLSTFLFALALEIEQGDDLRHAGRDRQAALDGQVDLHGGSLATGCAETRRARPGR